MRGLFAALIIALFGAPCAQAQELYVAEKPLRLGYYKTFSHKSSDRYKHVIYKTVIPAGVIGIIGLRRTSGNGNWDAEIGTDVAVGTYERARLSGVVDSSQHSNGNMPDIVTTPPGGSATTYYLHVYSTDNQPGEWEVHIEHFDIISELASAVVTAGVQCLFTDCSSSSPPSVQDEWVGRAVGLGIAAFQSGTICSFGVRAVANEIQSEVAKEFPDSRFLQYGAISFLTSLGGKYADVSCPS